MAMLLGLVSFQFFLIDGDDVIEAGGERMLRREAVEDSNHFGLGQVGDGDCFGEAAGIHNEAATMDIDQDSILLLGRYIQRSDDQHRDAGDGAVRNVDWICLFEFFSCACLPGIRAFPLLLNRKVRFGVGHRFRQELLRLRTDGLRDGHDARDVGGALRIDIAGIFGGGGGRCCLCGDCGRGRDHEGGGKTRRRRECVSSCQPIYLLRTMAEEFAGLEWILA